MDVIGFKAAKCKNCYKCVRGCEVKAISIINEQAVIRNNHCILCGHCLDVCPQNAKTLISDLDVVKDYLSAGKTVVVSLAPSYFGSLNCKEPGQIITALRKLGFSYIHETSEGAVYVTAEYAHLLEEGKTDNIITTSCPSINDLIEIYYPELVPFLAPVDSPMIAHGKLLRARYGAEAKIVFVGPCIAKKREAENDERTKGYIDAVINFKELEEWFTQSGMDVTALEPSAPDNPNPEVNRLYPVSGGILSALASYQDNQKNYRKFYVHGIRNAIDLFDSMKRGEIHGSFIEVNTCTGGCIKGPGTDHDHISRFKVKLDMEEAIEKKPVAKDFPELPDGISIKKTFYDRSPKEKIPTEDEIANILAKIGKTKPEHFLNCGACGYASCRDKAIAVYQGKAELTMCIPYMQERAQSMSNVVLDTTPNIIIITDPDMRILEFSKAAEDAFHITRAKARESYLYDLIDHSDFLEVAESHQPILNKKVTYKNLGLITLQDIIYIEKHRCVLGIFQDITKEEEKNNQAYKLRVETIEMAQKVIDKQMMVAQEIAGLLGETTAETKVTLTKLRDMILFNGENVDETNPM
ncbi:MAG: [Fe-Fe] hydrogenase large subunit C-terminal domain-containing protein [Lachnospiraceae bacterium]